MVTIGEVNVLLLDYNERVISSSSKRTRYEIVSFYLTSPDISPLSFLGSYIIILVILFTSIGIFPVSHISSDLLVFSTVSKLSVYVVYPLTHPYHGMLAVQHCLDLTFLLQLLRHKNRHVSFYSALHSPMSISSLNSTRLFFLERMLVSTTSSCEYDIPWYLHNFPVSWLSLPVSGLPHISLVRNTPVSHFCSIIFTAAFGIVSHLWLNK